MKKAWAWAQSLGAWWTFRFSTRCYSVQSPPKQETTKPCEIAHETEREIEHEAHSPSPSSHNESESNGDDYGGDDYDGDSIAIIQLNSGDEFEADIVLLFNDEQISVTVLAPRHSSGRSTEKHVLDLIRQLSFEGGEYNSIANAILDIIQPMGEEEFRRIAPKAPTPASLRINTKLHSLLFPKTHYFVFRREAPDAQPRIVPMSSNEVQARAWAPPPYNGNLYEDGVDGNPEKIRLLLSRYADHFPQFTTNEIDVVEEIVSSGAVTRVRVASNNVDDVDNHNSDTALKDLLCKATDNASGLIGCPTLRRELACFLTLHEHGYQAFSSSTPAEPMRVCTPRLVGLVTHPENKSIVGFGREWIQGKRLADVLKREKRGKQLLLNNKQRWAQQLRESADALHALGLVWGDGKPGNLVVGVGEAHNVTGAGHGEEEAPSGDLWLIDFGGGWTDGWVDADKEDTMEGDEQAIRKILDALCK